MASVRDELVHDIGKLLLSDNEVSPRPWEAVSLVIDADDSDGLSMSGYLYGGGTFESFAPDDNYEELEEVLLQFRAETEEDKGEPWVALLIQVVRKTLKIEYTFEYSNPQRWQVTPKNLYSMVEDLRPKG